MEERVHSIDAHLRALLGDAVPGTIRCVLGCSDVAPIAALRKQMQAGEADVAALAHAVTRARDALMFLSCV